MSNKALLFRVVVSFAAAALLLLACAGAVSERGAGGLSDMSDEQFVASIKQEIDYQVTEKDALDNIGLARGKVVKWNGNITQIWNDRIHVLGRGEEERTNFFEFQLDHPLPRETHIGDVTQTLIVGDAIWVVGRIVNLETVRARSINIERISGIQPNISPLSPGEIGPSYNVTAPILKGYIISKDNDRNFENPVWIGHR
jgi:hypothetical protein